MKKRLSLLVLTFLVTNLFSTAQVVDFKEIEELTTNWLEIETYCIEPSKKAKEKTVTFDSHGYVVYGYFEKGRLCSDQIVTIYDNTPNKNIILQGKVSYDVNRLKVVGVWNKNLKENNSIYGSFYVSNTSAEEFLYSDKKTTDLSIKPTNVVFYSGVYLNCPTILYLGDTPYIYVDGKTGGRSYSLFTSPIKESVDKTQEYYDLRHFLQSASDNVHMIMPNGTEFLGSVKPFLLDDDTIAFTLLHGVKKKDDQIFSLTKSEQYTTLSQTIKSKQISLCSRALTLRNRNINQQSRGRCTMCAATSLTY